MKRKLLFILSISSFTVFAQTNIGFEDGTVNGWVCKSGFYGISAGNSGQCNPPPAFVYSFNSTTPLDGKKDNPLSPPWGDYDKYRHTIMSKKTFTDPNSNDNVLAVAPGNLFPSGTNNYSFRLGNAEGYKASSQKQAFAEAIKMTFTVDKTNAGLTYMYAAFLFDVGHPSNEAPRFEIKLTQVVNGKEEQIPCGYYQISAKDASAGFHDGAGWGNQVWKYTDWTKVALDLTTYMGKQVSIEFSTADCYIGDKELGNNQCSWISGTHSAYAYIDLYTAPVEISSPTICANATSIEICAPPGYKTYQWPSGQPGIQAPLDKQCVKILAPKAGDKYTVKMTSNAGVGCGNSMTIALKGTDFNVRDTSVCSNTLPFNITAKPFDPSGSYVWDWKPKVNLSCYDCKSPIFTPGVTTTYTVTMSDKNLANCDRIKNVTINVGTSFTVKTKDELICEGETVTLSASGADTYKWQPGGSTGATLTVSPTSTTTYTVTGKSATATCDGDATATAIVTVNKKPIVTVTDITICAGETAALNGTITGGGSTGTWIGGDGAFTPNRSALNATYAPSIAEKAAGKVLLTLESEDPFGPCEKDSKTLTITISPGVKADAGPDITICFGAAAKLNAPTSGGTWSGGTLASFSDVKDSKSIYTPTPAEQAAGKITLKYTVVNSSATCPGGSDEMVITIEKLSVNAGVDQTICFGETVKLNGSIGGNAKQGMWSGDGEFYKDKTDLTATYTPTQAEMAAGTVKLFLTTEGTEACPATSDSVIISIKPKAVVDAGPHQAICYPGAITLAGVISGGAISGIWSGGTGTWAPSANSLTAVYTPSDAEVNAGKAVLTLSANNSSGFCPGRSDEMTIAIEKVSVAAGADQLICFGETVKLNGSIGGTATKGTWSGNGEFDKDKTDLKATYKPTDAEMAAGTAKLFLTTDATDACPAKTDSMVISINPIAVVDAGPYQAICYPGSVPLAGIFSGGATSGSWSGGGGGYLPSPNSANAIYTPNDAEVKAGKALLTFTTNDPLGPCPAVSDTMSIAIYKNAVADAGKTTSVCMGSPILLDGKITGGNGTGTWSGGLGGSYVNSVNDLKASYTPTAADVAAGKVIFTLKTSATGLCPLDSATVTHFINPNPVISFAVDTPKACAPHCVDFTDSTVILGANIAKWEWDFGNKTTGTVKNPKDICYNEPGFYTVSLKATSDKGCVSKLEKPKMIETYPNPTAQFTAAPNPVPFYDPTVHFYDQSSNDVKTWVWNMGDGKIISPNVKDPVHQYFIGLATTYNVTLTVTNQYGCKDSIPHAVEIKPDFTFFIPNAFTPGNSETLNDTFYGKGMGIAEYHLWVFDRWGNVVFNTTDINTGWDGRANNGTDIAQQDVYVWKVKLKDVFGNNHEYIGTVTLVR